MTKVDRIPAPQRVTFDPESHALTINIGATCLQLVRKILHLIFFLLVLFFNSRKESLYQNVIKIFMTFPSQFLTNF